METIIAFLHILFITLFCYWLWRKQELPIRKFYWHALAAKLSAGILVGIIHAAFYSNNDTFSIFEWASQLSQQAHVDFSGYLGYLWSGGSEGYFPGEERTIFLVKITSVFALVTYDSYWITSLYLSLFSFLAGWRLTKLIWLNFPGVGIPAAIALLFFPSCVFWASGIIKESVAITGLYVLAMVFLRFWLRQRVTFFQVIVAVLATWIVWEIKYYFIGLFVPALLATWFTRVIVEKKGVTNFSIEVSIWFFIFFSICLAASFAHPNFSINRLPDVLVSNNQAFMKLSSPDGAIHFYDLQNTWLNIALNSPWALVSGLFRPFIWEADSVLKFVVAIENLVLLILVVIATRSLFNLRKSPHRLLVLAILVYAILLCVFLAISTPNFGTLVRYRVGFLPFLLILLINQPMIVRALSKSFNVHFSD
ncbi:MAG TPA: hypothetical protein VFU05_05855 [Cyclobacteriaceae bacterium]|nr:hypothetical protein [Cyclobacteriaceae bacterium]